MNPQFKKGVLELIVLEAVRRKDRYGYELVEDCLLYTSSPARDGWTDRPPWEKRRWAWRPWQKSTESRW